MTVPFAMLLAAGPPGGGSGSLLPVILQFGLIFVIFYFIMIRPQQKQRKEHERSLRALKRGDEIVTAGGIIAEVIHIKENVVDGAPKPGMDDRITIKSAESRVVVERGRIARVITPAADRGNDTGSSA